jgi:hypothetical protein
MDQVQAPDALVGAWRSASWETRAADGQVTHPMGTDILGRCSTPPTAVSRSPSRGGSARFAAGDLLGGTTEEKAQAMEGLVAYAGRYSFHGDRVIHHVELSLFLVGSAVTSSVGRTGRGSADPQRQPAAGGQAPGPRLVWERVDSSPGSTDRYLAGLMQLPPRWPGAQR